MMGVLTLPSGPTSKAPRRCGLPPLRQWSRPRSWPAAHTPPLPGATSVACRVRPLAERHVLQENNMSSNGTMPDHVGALLRHFADLRDGTHGDASSRQGKEELFAEAAVLLDPYARQALDEINSHLLLGTGELAATGVRRSSDGGVNSLWTLSWPEQRAAGINPILILAFYGAGFHHPHLRGGTVGEWPLNVFTPEQAMAELPTLRAITAADLHNLVFQRDYRIVPALRGR